MAIAKINVLNKPNNEQNIAFAAFGYLQMKSKQNFSVWIGETLDELFKFNTHFA